MKHNHSLFMDFARRVAEESTAVRLKVGAVLARDGNVLAIGYNGTPSGWDNVCEMLVPDVDSDGNPLPPVLVTKPETCHAEENIIKKMANSTNTISGATLYITHSPCVNCAKLFVGVGLKQVIYDVDFRIMDGVNLLRKDGVDVVKYEELRNRGCSHK